MPTLEDLIAALGSYTQPFKSRSGIVHVLREPAASLTWCGRGTGGWQLVAVAVSCRRALRKAMRHVDG